MNYRHIYHAGGFSDVVKHLALITILDELQKKDTPLTILDPFAGIGVYDLNSIEANQTLEYTDGICKLITQTISNIPPIIRKYLDIISSFNIFYKDLSRYKPSLKNESNNIELIYPGSPTIISQMLRNNDMLIASELHPQDYAELKYNMRHYKNTTVHLIDGYNAIKAFIPPKTSRGLVFLDAAFEVKNEYIKLIDSLKLIKKRFAAGVVVIWYPITQLQLVNQFYEKLMYTGYPEFIKIEFGLKKNNEKMNKCGILIANPPNIQTQITKELQWLSDTIYTNQSEVEISIL
jgi:23S rRNA (adenine2030-N6)-methyltransferase